MNLLDIIVPLGFVVLVCVLFWVGVRLNYPKEKNKSGEEKK